ASDFDHLASTVPIGEAAARKASARLAQLSLDADEYQRLLAARVAPPANTAAIDEIRFTPMAGVNPDVVRGSMQTREGEPFESATLDRDLRRIYGSGDFERVGYSLLEERGRRVLVVDAVQKS